jgi:hypothetical protein
MWFLQQKVILTKDNPSKRNWHGCKKCAFCHHDESIDHLFFDCPFARLIWRLVFFTFNITQPTNCTNMFGNWLNGIDRDIKARIRVGTCAIVWSLWNCRNDITFNKKGTAHFLQVIRYGYSLDPRVGVPVAGGAAGTYGLSRDGCTGYLQPGWLAAF